MLLNQLQPSIGDFHWIYFSAGTRQKTVSTLLIGNRIATLTCLIFLSRESVA